MIIILLVMVMVGMGRSRICCCIKCQNIYRSGGVDVYIRKCFTSVNHINYEL